MAKSDTCPLCGRPVGIEYKPFCGRGCKDRDLLKWLGEGYRIPGEATDRDAQTGVDSADTRD